MKTLSSDEHESPGKSRRVGVLAGIDLLHCSPNDGDIAIDLGVARQRVERSGREQHRASFTVRGENLGFAGLVQSFECLGGPLPKIGKRLRPVNSARVELMKK